MCYHDIASDYRAIIRAGHRLNIFQNRELRLMVPWLDPHIHMISRVTDDYHRMAQCGCLAISEPAFWAGFDRGSAEGFRDYFRHLTEVEPKRAAQFGIKHFSWLCINAKEAENVSLSREVIALIPEYLDK